MASKNNKNVINYQNASAAAKQAAARIAGAKLTKYANKVREAIQRNMNAADHYPSGIASGIQVHVNPIPSPTGLMTAEVTIPTRISPDKSSLRLVEMYHMQNHIKTGGYNLTTMYEEGWTTKPTMPWADWEGVGIYEGTHAIQNGVDSVAGIAAADGVSITYNG